MRPQIKLRTLRKSGGDLGLRSTEVGLRLRGCVRSSDLLARLGGDEFAVVQCNVRSHGEIRALARRIIEMMDQPYMIEGYNIQVRASIGIASTRTSGQDTNAIMKHADLALYEAKARGRGRYCFFNKLMSEAASRRREIEEELRTAIGWNQLELHYQPIVTTSDHRIVGFEALLRWNHPGGAISPVEFIPLAEETGMIIPIGEWVIQEASQQLRLWPEDIFIAVNISPVQLRDQQLISVLCNALNGLLPHRMHIEITETTILDGSEGIRQTLNKIAELGIEISLDDFGTGYSSLTYLRKYPFKSIKVDRSFIAEICSPGPSATIVASVTELAHGLGMWVIAEGVETNCQLERVRSFGCEATQGYYFSRPLNAEGAGLLLQDDRLFVDRNDIVSDGN